MYSSVNILLDSWEMICIFLTNYLKPYASYIIASVIYNMSHYHQSFRLPMGLLFIFVGRQYLNEPNSFINPVRSPHPSDEESVKLYVSGTPHSGDIFLLYRFYIDHTSLMLRQTHCLQFHIQMSSAILENAPWVQPLSLPSQ